MRTLASLPICSSASAFCPPKEKGPHSERPKPGQKQPWRPCEGRASARGARERTQSCSQKQSGAGLREPATSEIALWPISYVAKMLSAKMLVVEPPRIPGKAQTLLSLPTCLH